MRYIVFIFSSLFIFGFSVSSSVWSYVTDPLDFDDSTVSMSPNSLRIRSYSFNSQVDVLSEKICSVQKNLKSRLGSNKLIRLFDVHWEFLEENIRTVQGLEDQLSTLQSVPTYVEKLGESLSDERIAEKLHIDRMNLKLNVITHFLNVYKKKKLTHPRQAKTKAYFELLHMHNETVKAYQKRCEELEAAITKF